MNKKIVFLDVDGTLSLPIGKVSDLVKKAISQAREKGHYVFLCTGRNRAGIQSLMDIGFDGVICSAGGYIEIQGKKVYESCLRIEDLQEAREIFEQNHVIYNIETNDMTFQTDEMNKAFINHQLTGKHVNSEMTRLINEQKEQFNIHSIEEFDEHPISAQKLCFIAKDEKDLIQPRRLLSNKFNFIIHDIFDNDLINGEIIIKGTNKGNAIRYVVDALGLSMADTIGFGDSMNDYEMIYACAYGVVMENGSKELKQYATSICESVQNDGVYHEFYRLGLCNEMKA